MKTFVIEGTGTGTPSPVTMLRIVVRRWRGRTAQLFDPYKARASLHARSRGEVAGSAGGRPNVRSDWPPYVADRPVLHIDGHDETRALKGPADVNSWSCIPRDRDRRRSLGGLPPVVCKRRPRNPSDAFQRAGGVPIQRSGSRSTALRRSMPPGHLSQSERPRKPGAILDRKPRQFGRCAKVLPRVIGHPPSTTPLMEELS